MLQERQIVQSLITSLRNELNNFSQPKAIEKTRILADISRIFVIPILKIIREGNCHFNLELLFTTPKTAADIAQKRNTKGTSKSVTITLTYPSISQRQELERRRSLPALERPSMGMQFNQVDEDKLTDHIANQILAAMMLHMGTETVMSMELVEAELTAESVN